MMIARSLLGELDQDNIMKRKIFIKKTKNKKQKTKTKKTKKRKSIAHLKSFIESKKDRSKSCFFFGQNVFFYFFFMINSACNL